MGIACNISVLVSKVRILLAAGMVFSKLFCRKNYLTGNKRCNTRHCLCDVGKFSMSRFLEIGDGKQRIRTSHMRNMVANVTFGAGNHRSIRQNSLMWRQWLIPCEISDFSWRSKCIKKRTFYLRYVLRFFSSISAYYQNLVNFL